MRVATLIVLTCLLALSACKAGPKEVPTKSDGPNPAVAAPAPEAPAVAAPAPAAEAAANEGATALDALKGELPSAAYLAALLDQATRVHAQSGGWEEEQWSKDLSAESMAMLRAGIGEAQEIVSALPRCLPTVQLTLYRQEEVLATLGAFCDSGSYAGPIRFAIGEVVGSFTPEDIAKVGAAIAAAGQE